MPALEPVLLKNGRFHTLNPARPRASAVLVKDGRIAGVGEVSDFPSGGQRLDLQGRCVLPGLTDCHVHFRWFANSLSWVHLAGVADFGEVKRRVKEAAGRASPGEWVRGEGWDKNLWDLGRFPNKGDLDPFTPGNPVLLDSRDGHVIWCNTPALRKAGIDRNTPEIPGGEIERDMKGEPTGIFKEEAEKAIERAAGDLPWEQEKRAFLLAQKEAQRFGLTGVHDCSSENRKSPIKLIQELREEGKLGLRFTCMIARDALDDAIQLGIRTGAGDEWLRWGGVKILTDGALGSQTAAMMEPYEGSGQKGILAIPEEVLQETIRKAAVHGISSTVHAIGDYANRVVLDAMAEARKNECPDRSLWLRNRIEHAQCVRPEDVRRFRDLGVVASLQPVHIPGDISTAERNWGKRCANAYVLKSFLEAGVPLCLGSDAAVETLDPLKGIWTAVCRQKWDGTPKQGWYPEQRISSAQAVRGYTLGAAYASGEENLKGSIQTGKLADFTVLGRDLFEVPKEEIRDIVVEMTILGGEVVYSRE
jgi:hypothetical protein